MQTKLDVMKPKPGLGTFMPSSQKTDPAYSASVGAHTELQ